MVYEGVVPLPRPQTATADAQLVPRLDQFTAPVDQVVAPARADVAFVGVLSALAAVLAARLLLLLGVVGGFVLALLARDTLGFYVLIAYCVLLVIPLVALDIVTRRK